MTTAYSELYGFVRTAIGDPGGDVPDYSSGSIDAAISLWLLREDDYSKTTVLGAKHITPDLTDKDDTFRISINAAIFLATPNAHSFSHKSPVLSVQRGSRFALVERLKTLLRDSEGIALDSDDSITALLEGFSRYDDSTSSGVVV